MANKQTSITDLKEIVVEVQAEAMELVREVLQEIVLPQVKMAARAKWAAMPDETKERFKQERPNEYAEFMKG